jgi:hypothetical protein
VQQDDLLANRPAESKDLLYFAAAPTWQGILTLNPECSGENSSSPHAQFICRFQYRPTAAADDRAAVSAGQRIGDFSRALRAVELRFLSVLVCHDAETNT